MVSLGSAMILQWCGMLLLFSIRCDGGGWAAFHLFSLFCAACFTFVFDGGGAAGHINRDYMEFEVVVN